MVDDKMRILAAMKRSGGARHDGVRAARALRRGSGGGGALSAGGHDDRPDRRDRGRGPIIFASHANPAGAARGAGGGGVLRRLLGAAGVLRPWRPLPLGLILSFDAERVAVVDVVPGSAAARAGFEAGDLLSASGAPINGRLHWMAIGANLETGRPAEMRIIATAAS